VSPRERRFAVVGCGSIGSRHLRNLAALGCRDLIAIDPDPERRSRAAIETGAREAPSLAAALEEGASVVFVTTPTAHHIPPALEAVRAGADLFIEKPLSSGLDGVAELLEEAERHGTTALVGCNLRFHPGLARVHRLAAGGAVGRIVSARIEFGSWLPDWRPTQDYRLGYAARRESGGGIVLDAIHELDYARWLLGEVQSVACFAGSLSSLELETEDVAAILLRFESGAIGEVHLDYVQRAYSRTCQLIGEEGTLRWDWSAGEVRRYRADTGAWLTVPDPPGWEPNAMYVAELEHFLACLAGDETPALDLPGAARVLEIALAALASAESGDPVPLREQVAA
jgi:predicted dehydrogenase